MKRKTAIRGVRFGVTLTVEDIAESLAMELDRDEMVELIIDLDKACAEWGVTEKLHKHFTKEMRKLLEDEKMIASVTPNV